MPIGGDPAPFSSKGGIEVPLADEAPDATVLWRDAAGALHYGPDPVAAGDQVLSPRVVVADTTLTVPSNANVLHTGTVKVNGTVKLGNNAQMTGLRAGA